MTVAVMKAIAAKFGTAEELLGESLRPELRARRDDLVVATKGGVCGAGVNLDSLAAQQASQRVELIGGPDAFGPHLVDRQTRHRDVVRGNHDLWIDDPVLRAEVNQGFPVDSAYRRRLANIGET